jgi:hypothetical protein
MGAEVKEDGGDFDQNQEKAKIAEPDVNRFEVCDPEFTRALSLKVFL